MLTDSCQKIYVKKVPSSNILFLAKNKNSVASETKNPRLHLDPPCPYVNVDGMYTEQVESLKKQIEKLKE
ncbi:hypothetical protein BC936DRAFT_142095 [Jimgerdemannia flammicorona]|nr:hypothetical protein BC936DRAFT_142095 [Jimgerdemannia flammicorona]